MTGFVINSSSVLYPGNEAFQAYTLRSHRGSAYVKMTSKKRPASSPSPTPPSKKKKKRTDTGQDTADDEGDYDSVNAGSTGTQPSGALKRKTRASSNECTNDGDDDDQDDKPPAKKMKTTAPQTTGRKKTGPKPGAKAAEKARQEREKTPENKIKLLFPRARQREIDRLTGDQIYEEFDSLYTGYLLRMEFFFHALGVKGTSNDARKKTIAIPRIRDHILNFRERVHGSRAARPPTANDYSDSTVFVDPPTDPEQRGQQLGDAKDAERKASALQRKTTTGTVGEDNRPSPTPRKFSKKKASAAVTVAVPSNHKHETTAKFSPRPEPDGQSYETPCSHLNGEKPRPQQIPELPGPGMPSSLAQMSVSGRTNNIAPYMPGFDDEDAAPPLAEDENSNTSEHENEATSSDQAPTQTAEGGKDPDDDDDSSDSDGCDDEPENRQEAYDKDGNRIPWPPRPDPPPQQLGDIKSWRNRYPNDMGLPVWGYAQQSNEGHASEFREDPSRRVSRSSLGENGSSGNSRALIEHGRRGWQLRGNASLVNAMAERDLDWATDMKKPWKWLPRRRELPHRKSEGDPTGFHDAHAYAMTVSLLIYELEASVRRFGGDIALQMIHVIHHIRRGLHGADGGLVGNDKPDFVDPCAGPGYTRCKPGWFKVRENREADAEEKGYHDPEDGNESDEADFKYQEPDVVHEHDRKLDPEMHCHHCNECHHPDCKGETFTSTYGYGERKPRPSTKRDEEEGSEDSSQHDGKDLPTERTTKPNHVAGSTTVGSGSMNDQQALSSQNQDLGSLEFTPSIATVENPSTTSLDPETVNDVRSEASKSPDPSAPDKAGQTDDDVSVATVSDTDRPTDRPRTSGKSLPGQHQHIAGKSLPGQRKNIGGKSLPGQHRQTAGKGPPTSINDDKKPQEQYPTSNMPHKQAKALAELLTDLNQLAASRQEAARIGPDGRLAHPGGTGGGEVVVLDDQPGTTRKPKKDKGKQKATAEPVKVSEEIGGDWDEELNEEIAADHNNVAGLFTERKKSEEPEEVPEVEPSRGTSRRSS